MFLQAKKPASRAVPAIVHDVLRSPGQPLQTDTRSTMERRFSHDFSNVRVHADRHAAESAAAVGALAYTAGPDVVFAAGQYRPATNDGDRLLAHELTHVAQQRAGTVQRRGGISDSVDPSEQEADAVAANGSAESVAVRGDSNFVQRKIEVRNGTKWWGGAKWSELSPVQREDFVKRNFPKKGDHAFATSIVEDMEDATDQFWFDDEAELVLEITKRMKTSRLMRETQESGPRGKSFGYPDKTLGPRVNKAAAKSWGPVQDLGGDYYFELTPAGRSDAYEALKTLFTPQTAKEDRTLIHCDYLASVVHFRVFAETTGVKEFNKSVIDGTIPVILKWNGFSDIEPRFWRSSKQESLQEVRPSSERDLVIGDHVIFWNHRAYDLINWNVGEAWKLENAILEKKEKGEDIFEGHGSGPHTNDGMRNELTKRYNEVANKALVLIGQTKSKDKTTRTEKRKELNKTFPRLSEVGVEWRIQGTAHSKTFDEKLVTIKASDKELVGLRDPNDPTQMNLVKRPKESAK